LFARGALKKLWREDLSRDDAVLCSIQSLYDAADEDSATGGPDVTRRIFPVVSVVTSDGYHRLSDDEVGGVVDAVIAGRMVDPGGPQASLH
jgi:proteasome beta subunit